MSDSNPVIDSMMERVVNTNLLKYAAGQTMFCPGCKNCMDWRTTTVLTLHQGEKCVSSEVLCGACHTRHKRREFWGEVMASLERRMRDRQPGVDPQLHLEVVMGPDVGKARKLRSKKGTK